MKKIAGHVHNLHLSFVSETLQSYIAYEFQKKDNTPN